MKTTYKGMKIGDKRTTSVVIMDYSIMIPAGTEFIIEEFVPSVCTGFDQFFLFSHLKNGTIIRAYKNETK